MEPLPTRSEFAARQRDYASRFRRAATKTFVIGGVVFIAGIVVTMAAADHADQRWLGWIGFGVASVAVFGGLFYLDRQRTLISRSAHVDCPRCKQPVLLLNAKLALTTGRCAECGEVIVRDSDRPPGEV